MSQYAVAQDVGLLGYAILIEIALSEDKRRYTSPPKWFMAALADRLDRKKEAVSEAIKRCVDNGWLVWQQGAHRTKATAWITIPSWIDESAIDDPSDLFDRSENPTDLSTTDHANQGAVRSEKPTNDRTESIVDQVDRSDFPTKHQAKGPTNHPSKHQAKGPTNHPASYIPILSSPSPTKSEERAGEWELAKELKEIGIGKPVEAARAGLSTLTLQQLRLHLDHFRSKPGAWGPVIVYRRLNSLSLALLSPDEGWPPPLPGYTSRVAVDARSQREAVQATSERQAEAAKADEVARYTQLLIDWERDYGPKLDAMPKDDVLALCPDDSVREWFIRRGRSYPMVREALLRVLAKSATHAS